MKILFHHIIPLIISLFPFTNLAMNTNYQTIKIDDTKIYYRSAENPQNPAILLLHGFPSSSHMFHELIPLLATEFYVVAPDYPGLGQTKSLAREKFEYSFDHISRIIDKFTEEIGLTRFAIYIFDYGAPIGLRLAMWHPDRITAIISQNGNAYREGLGLKWAAREEYWENPTTDGRKKIQYCLCP